jgi:putative flippase GtrA
MVSLPFFGEWLRIETALWRQSGWRAFRHSQRLKLARYALAGIAISMGYTLTVILLVEGLSWMSPALASAVSFALWTPVSYLVHRDFTFLFAVAAGQLAAIVKFTISFFVRLGTAAYTVQLMSGFFGSHYLVGVFANWIVLPLISYLIMDWWVFRSPPESAAHNGDRGGDRRRVSPAHHIAAEISSPPSPSPSTDATDRVEASTYTSNH